jgi:S1-C subfamily serine protease
MSDLEDEQRFNSEGRAQAGVLVIGFPRTGDSPAHDAGIEIGDVILSFNGKPVMNQTELMGFIGEADAGTVVPIEVRRGGDTLAMQVTLGKRAREIDQR